MPFAFSPACGGGNCGFICGIFALFSPLLTKKYRKFFYFYHKTNT